MWKKKCHFLSSDYFSKEDSHYKKYSTLIIYEPKKYLENFRSV